MTRRARPGGTSAPAAEDTAGALAGHDVLREEARNQSHDQPAQNTHVSLVPFPLPRSKAALAALDTCSFPASRLAETAHRRAVRLRSPEYEDDYGRRGRPRRAGDGGARR